ncbi:MAG: hypothetical protein E7039_00535 [Lentisphaerae bacterium]|nr:hypothetical protein [Lentisphaerota bacterium]
MLKSCFITLFCAVLSGLIGSGCSTTTPEPFKQEWPKDKTLKLTSGDYTVTTGKRFNGKIAGLAFQGKELFTKAGTTQLGTLYEAPFPKDKNAQYIVVVDGKIPEVVGDRLAGREIEIYRWSDYGDLKIFANYTLTNEGLTWRVRYKIVSEKHKAKYFYLFTLPWSSKFSEFVYWNKDVQKSGKFSNSKKWLVCDNMDALLLYSPELKVAAVTEVVGNIPVESRKHTLWDLPNFHKYFLFHALPEWKVGCESPTYTLKIRAFAANENNYIQKSNILK